MRLLENLFCNRGVDIDIDHVNLYYFDCCIFANVKSYLNNNNNIYLILLCFIDVDSLVAPAKYKDAKLRPKKQLRTELKGTLAESIKTILHGMH